MGTINLQIPQLGSFNSIADPLIASDFIALQTAINGQLDHNNLSPTAGLLPAQLAGASLGLTTAVTSGTVSAVAGQMVVATASLTVNLPSTPAKDDTIGVLIGGSAVTGAAPVFVVAPTHGIYGGGLGPSGATNITLGALGAWAILKFDGSNWGMIGQIDTGWVTLTLATNVGTGIGFSNPPEGRLQGDSILLRGVGENNTGGTITAGTTFATLPTGMRPATPIPLVVNQTGTIVGASVATSGAISLELVGWPSATWLSLDDHTLRLG
jgi:hypothetical protein